MRLGWALPQEREEGHHYPVIPPKVVTSRISLSWAKAVHTCIPSTRRRVGGGQENCEFKTSLGYIT